MVAQLDNIFKPIESMFEETTDANSPSSGSYNMKRKEEKYTRPLPSVVKYIEEQSVYSPRTSGAYKAMISRKSFAAKFLDQLKPKTKFLGSAIEESQLPLASLPEIAVVGRSNCGKSSLINAIVGTRCCQVVNKPGSTELMNFYRIGDPPLVSFVDVPGFGFAYTDKKTQDQRTEFSLWYLRSRKNLGCTLIVVDARHGLADSDRELITFFRNNKINFRLVLNKCDLVEARALAQRITVIGNDLGIKPSELIDTIIPVSALRNLGIEKIQKICEKFKMNREIIVEGRRRFVMDLLEERRLKRLSKKPSSRSGTAPNLAEFKDVSTSKKSAGRKHAKKDMSSCFEDEADAYTPSATSIVKRVMNDSGEIRMLNIDDFISQDEVENLGLRGGRQRSDLPPPSEAVPTNYETQMKINHSLDWKMRLDALDGRVSEPQGNPTRSDSSPQSDDEISALGFISTYNPVSTPKGIAKWKVPGMKPTIKTSRYKKKSNSVASEIVKSRM
jgi:ribosome biogenesis GTP-binding protein YsxC/EngB